jgi:hypothetical protein
VELILKDGTRKPVCAKCHRVNVTMRLKGICDECAHIVGVPDSQVVRPRPRWGRRALKRRAELAEALLQQSRAV